MSLQKKSKILIVNTVSTRRNGITGVIFNYLRAAEDGDMQMDLLSLNSPDSFYKDKIEKNGGKVIVVPRQWKKLLSYWNKLRKVIKDGQYDAVHIHGNSHTTVLELSAARAAGCVVGVVHAHNTTCKHVVVHKVLTPVFNALCTHRLACGEAAGHFMFGNKPFTVMNNGVDTQRFAFDDAMREKMRTELGWEYCKVIGHVGYFSEVKNHKFIVDVFEQAYRKDNRYRLLLIGDGKLREEIETRIAEKGLTNVVHLTGNIDNVDEYLNAMDVILMPSLFEGLPLTLIEQQANGLQCVVSDAITKEVDKTGNVVFLPLSESPEYWAEQLDAVVDDYDRKDRSDKSIEHITEGGYSIQREAVKLKYYFETAIDNAAYKKRNKLRGGVIPELDNEQRQQIQQLETEILMEADRICRKHGLHYSVAYGSLIGAIRHKGFIPWDDDIDICIPREDYNRFKEICMKELGDMYFYQTNASDPNYFYLYDKIRMNGTVFRETATSIRDIHHGVYVDVFPVDNISDNNFMRRLQYFLFQGLRYGVQSKAVVLSSRSGLKKMIVMALRVLYLPFPTSYLYKKAQKVMTWYQHEKTGNKRNFCGIYGEREVLPANIFNSYTDMNFETNKVMVYRDFDTVLTKIYGDYMKLPPKEKRVTRHPIEEIILP